MVEDGKLVHTTGRVGPVFYSPQYAYYWLLSRYSSIMIVDSDELKPSWETTRSWQIMTCTVSANGEIRPIWRIGTDSRLITILTLSSEVSEE